MPTMKQIYTSIANALGSINKAEEIIHLAAVQILEGRIEFKNADPIGGLFIHLASLKGGEKRNLVHEEALGTWFSKYGGVTPKDSKDLSAGWKTNKKPIDLENAIKFPYYVTITATPAIKKPKVDLAVLAKGMAKELVYANLTQGFDLNSITAEELLAALKAAVNATTEGQLEKLEDKAAEYREWFEKQPATGTTSETPTRVLMH